MLELSLLGTSGVMPLPDRYLTSLYIKYNGKKLLIDCGEATQMSIKELGWGYKNLEVICLTHYHGDHITGLPGILFMLENTGRTKPLTIVGPPGLKKVITSFTELYGKVPYEINLMELEMKPQVVNIGDFTINVVPANHKVLCFGYVIEVVRKPRFDMKKATKNKVPRKYWKSLQNNETITQNNKTYTPDMVLGQIRKGIKVSYITDTRPTKEIQQAIKDSDLFIGECMYVDKDYIEQVEKNKHMLGVEAAQLAKKSKCKELWLTHFSPAITREGKIDITPVKKIFKNTSLGKDRKIVRICFESDD